jgi:Flp pilus assembly pilin Flp
MWRKLQKIWVEEEAVTTVEYAILLALLVVAAITVWTLFGNTIVTKVASSSNSLNSAL